MASQNNTHSQNQPQGNSYSEKYAQKRAATATAHLNNHLRVGATDPRKKAKIQTEELLQEVELLMSKGHKKPNQSIVDSKSSLSQKQTFSDVDVSLSHLQDSKSRKHHKAQNSSNNNLMTNQSSNP